MILVSRKVSPTIVVAGLVAAGVVSVSGAALAGGRAEVPVACERPVELVEAVTAANASGVATVITLNPDGQGDCVYTFEQAASDDAAIERALPTVTGTITIKGHGSSLDAQRKFGVVAVAAGGELVLEDVTLTDGVYADEDEHPEEGGTYTGEGGGIHNAGTLVLDGASKVIDSGAREGGGLYNAGVVTLNGESTITGNTAYEGGGIYNTGTVTVNDKSTVTSNGADDSKFVPNSGVGGGIYNDKTAHEVTLNGSSAISGNSAFEGGGIYNNSSVVLNDASSVAHNAAEAEQGASVSGVGGGIYNTSTVTVNGSSAITENIADAEGGGVYNAGTLNLNDNGLVNGNANSGQGAGIYSHGNVIMDGSSKISDNIGPHGAGIHNANGVVTMNGSNTINGNTARGIKHGDGQSGGRGGGVYNEGTLQLNATSAITGNTASDADPPLESKGEGGGIYNTGTVHRNGAVITGNTPDDCRACEQNW